jgi:hypothetical protein
MTSAAACLFLAAKLEESPRKYRELISVFYYIESQIQNLDRVLDLNSYELIDRKEALMTQERTIIKELGFEMHTL